jgi:hypothetical protein
MQLKIRIVEIINLKFLGKLISVLIIAKPSTISNRK